MTASDTRFPADENDIEGQSDSSADEVANDSQADEAGVPPAPTGGEVRDEEVEGQSMPFRRN